MTSGKDSAGKIEYEVIDFPWVVLDVESQQLVDEQRVMVGCIQDLYAMRLCPSILLSSLTLMHLNRMTSSVRRIFEHKIESTDSK